MTAAEASSVPTLPRAPSSSSSPAATPGSSSKSLRLVSPPTRHSPTQSCTTAWKRWKEQGQLQDGELLPMSQLEAFMADLNLSATDIRPSLEAQGSGALTFEQLRAACSAIEPSSPSCSTPHAEDASVVPLRKCLSKNRAYLGTGYLVYDDTVITYIRKLEEHRKKCEAEGRYKEAKAAASRLVELKTAQVARMRQELLIAQTQELAEVHKVYEEETRNFHTAWETRVKEYHQTFARAVEELQAAQQQQLDTCAQELEAKRPMKPKPSRDYLNQKKVEASLAKVKEYKRASQVKAATEEMYQAELHQAQQAFDSDLRLKMAKLVAKQKVEMEALAQRGVRGKSELELRRATETERRMFRFRNIVMELESLHKLEVVSLENFLDGQVLAGKATPLEDGFRRKREQLFSSQF